MIKQIGASSRTKIESLFGTHVFLELRVQVRKGWTKDEQDIERFTGEGIPE